jgi:hypothetical protein
MLLVLGGLCRQPLESREPPFLGNLRGSSLLVLQAATLGLGILRGSSLLVLQAATLGLQCPVLRQRRSELSVLLLA